jgi:hypothetical protein
MDGAMSDSCLCSERIGVTHLRKTTVVIHILIWLGIALASALSIDHTVPASEAGNSSGASHALAPVSPNHQDLIRWIDLEAGGPLTYNEWKAGLNAPGPFQYEHLHSQYPLGSIWNSSRVAVMVNANLWEPLEASLQLHALDLAGEGFSVDIYTVSGGIAEEMRGLLQNLHVEGLKGAIFVGDLPIAWYEMDGCYDPPYPFHLEFPCDFFYMDLNGVFQDTDADGLYDYHTGDRAPEIWIGRLTASPLIAGGSSEIELLENYFRKNHLYRSNLAPLAHRGLAYLDDDCIFLTYHLNILQSEFTGGCTAINDPWTTWDTHYENTLTEPHELIQLWAHSNPVHHGFTNPASQWSFTYSWEIPAIDPRVYFYILCACSNARYTTTDYMGGWYVFSPTYGLAAIGNTTLGAMIYCHDFYPSLGYQKPIGDAYMDWFLAQAAGGFWEWEECYYYGLTLLGDPTLRIQEKSNSRMIQYDNEWGGSSVCLPNGYGMDLFNTRFTASKSCSLKAVLMLANPWSGAPTCRIYVWNSDGTFPTDKIDSIDVQLDPANIGRWTWVDVSQLRLQFSEGEDFHIGFTVVNLQPGERVDLHAGVRVDTLPMRSSLMYNGEWILFDDLDPEAHNFDIRVVVVQEPEPVVEITTLTIPHASLEQHYDQTLEVVGGTPPYFWDLTAGGLPDGFILDVPTGAISGQPKGVDTAHFTARVTDSSTPPLSDIQHLTLVINSGSDVEDDEGSVPPEDFVLRQNYPNPFNSSTLIIYNLPKHAHVTVEIFNVLGQRIRSLVDDEQSVGSYVIEWDGRSDDGHELGTGVYFYRVAAGDQVEVKKMLLLK